MIKWGGLLVKLFGLSIIAGLPLMKIVLASIAKGVLIPLGLTIVELVAGSSIQKYIRFRNKNINSFKRRNGEYYQSY